MSAPAAQPNTIQLAAVPPQINPPADTMLLYFDKASGKLIAVDHTGTSVLPASGTPGGSDTNLQFNDAGALGGMSGWSWDKTSNQLIWGVADDNAAIEFNPSNHDSSVSTDFLLGPTSGISMSQSSGATTAQILVSPDALTVSVVGPTVSLQSGGTGIKIGASVGQKVGFFGKAPVVQQATPVTLGDVIALLQAYGLSA